MGAFWALRELPMSGIINCRKKLRRFMGKSARLCAIVSAFVSAATLLSAQLSPASAQTTGKVTQARHSVDVPSDVVVKEMHITLLKFALNLRPAQQPYWAPVEAALHEMAQWQATATSELSASGRASSAVVLRLKRIAALAVPLIRALDENQKRSMMILARSTGLEMLLASK
jgi:hypothetical protein